MLSRTGSIQGQLFWTSVRLTRDPIRFAAEVNHLYGFFTRSGPAGPEPEGTVSLELPIDCGEEQADLKHYGLSLRRRLAGDATIVVMTLSGYVIIL